MQPPTPGITIAFDCSKMLLAMPVVPAAHTHLMAL
jgi:hypothetical protein